MKNPANILRLFKGTTPGTAAPCAVDEPLLQGESRELKAETLAEWPFPFNLEERDD